jgi:pimeloyl-ACP methyl ester carboxylesterase
LAIGDDLDRQRRFFRQRAQALPATRFEEIHAGHVPQDDSPEQTNAILREWLAGV